MNKASADFQEIAHCGGRVTFHVVTRNGQRGYQVSWQHSAHGPAGIFGVFATIAQGIVVGEMKLGMGESGPPPMPDCVPVIIASDNEGLFGHECPSCQQYWRAGGRPRLCPYCRIVTESFTFLTRAQRSYVVEYCNKLWQALESEGDGDYVIDMDAVAKAVQSESKPSFYYTEESQQNNFRCDACHYPNDILGTCGYCSFCGTRNDLQVLNESLKGLRERINAGGPYETHVRDAVSNFDSFCNRFASQLLDLVPMTRRRRGWVDAMGFHALQPTTDMFKDVFDIDVFDGIAADDVEFAIRQFHRRHVYEHSGGEADARYIADSGDKVRLGQALREDKASAHRTVTVVLQMARNIHRDFHEIIPPLDNAI